ncbi:Catenin delta-1, partial [Xenoophorus captivus]
TLWNLSSQDSVKMEIVDHALHALSDEVMVTRSGWERGSNGAGGGEEDCKPRHLEWEIALTNTAGCLRYGRRKGRNVGSFGEQIKAVAYGGKA